MQPHAAKRVALHSVLLLALLTQVTCQVSNCPAGCRKHGTCHEELGRCDCPKHMDGPTCSTSATEEELTKRCTELLYADVKECLQTDPGPSCLNDCSYRGKCVSGFCRCNKGYYGTDCSLSLGPGGKPVLLAGTGYKPRAKRPWVYVYELPPPLTVWFNSKRLDRHTHVLFWQRLLSSGARVADPEQADWFFIPIRQRGLFDKHLLQLAIDYVRTTWPYWDKFQGHKHFMFATGDLGVDETLPDPRALAENVTWLSHWGLHKDHLEGLWHAAHRPGKDIVVPVMVSAGHYRHFGMERSPLHPLYNNSRPFHFFFAGRICGNRRPPDNSKPYPDNCNNEVNEYSAGTRQKVSYYHSNRTGYKIALGEHDYSRALKRHKFCLAPLGGGHGQRQIIVSFLGCIAVTIGDNVYQPFEPELDWTQFSVQVPEADIPHMHTHIDTIDASKLRRMQKALRCAAQHFVWTSIMGAFFNETGKYDAFETTLQIMWMQTKYPKAHPKEYVKLDPGFKRFMACGAEELGEDPPAHVGPPIVCSHTALEEAHPPTCYRCVRGSSISTMIPGGVICCDSKADLSKCPRLWP